MYTGNVWGVALIVVGLVSALVALQLLLSALFPRAAERSREAFARRPWGAFGLGLAAALLLALAAVLAGSAGAAGQLANLLLLSAALFASGTGLAGISRHVGERMPSVGAAAQPWRATLRGAVTLGLAWLLPVAGWLVVFPASLLTGLGAFALGALRGERVEPVAQRTASAPTPTQPAEMELVG